MSAASRSNKIALWATLAAAAGLVALLYARVFAYFIPRWFQEAPYRHCILVLPIIAWLIWRQRKKLALLSPTAAPSGLLLLALGLLIYLAGNRIGARLVIGVSLPFVLLGICASLFGAEYLKRLVIPLLLSFFLVPVPRHVLGLVAFPMQIFSAKASAVVARLTGIPVTTQGVNMDLGAFRFVVAQQCSGLNSLLALLLASAVLAELMELQLSRKFVVLLAAPFIVLASNIVRLVSVLWIAKFIGPRVALNALVHGTSDIIVYSVAVIFVLLLIGLLTPRQHGADRLAAVPVKLEDRLHPT